MVHSSVPGSASVNTVTQTGIDRSPDEPIRARARSAYAQLLMRFESNEGQFDAQVKYAAQGAGYALWLTGDQAVMTLGNRRNAADTVAQSSTGELKQWNRFTRKAPR